MWLTRSRQRRADAAISRRGRHDTFEGLEIMATTPHGAQDVHAHDAHDAHPHPTGWRRFVYSTNHKDIGTMYLVFALVGGLIGGALSIGMRLELMEPGVQIVHDPHMFNVFTTAHGLIMIFLLVMPAMIGGF